LLSPCLWERRGECPGAVPILAVHDEIVVEVDKDKAEEAQTWLKAAMVETLPAACWPCRGAKGQGDAPWAYG
jgi:hypothetical protein